jgi:hypothetical protein
MLATFALTALFLAGDAGPRLVFSKSFPGSFPDYYRVTLEPEGKARYEAKPDDDRAAEFKVSPELARQAFDLAARLQYFRGVPLETKKKIASMGAKTVIYQHGAERGEQTFNYSENPDAQELVNLFERISNTQQHRMALERLMRFDRLGLHKQLLQVEMAVNRRDLAEPALLAPILEEISRNKAFLGIAQERARIILAKIGK